MNEAIRKIADHYGLIPQLNVATEELAELIQAIARFRRVDERDMLELARRKNLVAEEIADVEVMLAQIKYLMKIDERVEAVAKYEIERQLKRMKKETKCKRTQEEKHSETASGKKEKKPAAKK